LIYPLTTSPLFLVNIRYGRWEFAPLILILAVWCYSLVRLIFSVTDNFPGCGFGGLRRLVKPSVNVGSVTNNN